MIAALRLLRGHGSSSLEPPLIAFASHKYRAPSPRLLMASTATQRHMPSLAVTCRYLSLPAVTCRYLPLPTVPTPQDLGREPTVQELDADREEAFKRELEERLGRPPFAKELAMYEAEAGLAPGGHLTEGGAPAGAPGQVR